MRLIFVRHTQTDFNKAKLYSGQLDVPLDPEGVRQAQALGVVLRQECFTHAYCSDLMRTEQTARIVLWPRTIEVARNSLLREVDVGLAAGLTRGQVMETYGNPVMDTRHPDFDFSLLGGESKKGARLRYVRFILGLTALSCKPMTGSILIVCHGTALRILFQPIGLELHPQGGYTAVEFEELFKLL
ncbi:MAG TPA: histidine phosphatase family protein [Candidatus Paceibacterota bacterium]